jgi:hypothetical protein
MKYSKPSVARLGTASGAIQGVGNGKQMHATDGISQEDLPSSGGAYDLDE